MVPFLYETSATDSHESGRATITLSLSQLLLYTE